MIPVFKPSKILANIVPVFINCWQYTECGLHSDYLRVFAWLFNESFLGLSFFDIYKWYSNG
jgi:hypothetical protein